MSKIKNKDAHPELATILGPNGEFEGKLSVKHSVRIDGYFKGEISTTETLTIGPNGHIEGNIIATDVIMGGIVQGTILAEGKVVLEETSRFQGDLKTVKLVIKEGAIFIGASDMSLNSGANNSHKNPEIA
jgi:cytoskeletal protein CcmA (bactofilin family)